jgi:hypothetical protein
MDIMVDYILKNDGQFRSDLLNKLNIKPVETVAKKEFIANKSSFGSSTSTKNVIIMIVVIAVLIFVFNGAKSKAIFFGRLS